MTSIGALHRECKPEVGHRDVRAQRPVQCACADQDLDLRGSWCKQDQRGKTGLRGSNELISSTRMACNASRCVAVREESGCAGFLLGRSLCCDDSS